MKLGPLGRILHKSDSRTDIITWKVKKRSIANSMLKQFKLEFFISSPVRRRIVQTKILMAVSEFFAVGLPTQRSAAPVISFDHGDLKITVLSTLAWYGGRKSNSCQLANILPLSYRRLEWNIVAKATANLKLPYAPWGSGRSNFKNSFYEYNAYMYAGNYLNLLHLSITFYVFTIEIDIHFSPTSFTNK